MTIIYEKIYEAKIREESFMTFGLSKTNLNNSQNYYIEKIKI